MNKLKKIMVFKDSDNQKTFANHNLKILKKLIVGKSIIPHILQVASAEFLSGQSIETHFHDSMDEFFYILDGNFEFIIEDVKYHLKKDDSILVKKQKLFLIQKCCIFQ